MPKTTSLIAVSSALVLLAACGPQMPGSTSPTAGVASPGVSTPGTAASIPAAGTGAAERARTDAPVRGALDVPSAAGGIQAAGTGALERGGTDAAQSTVAPGTTRGRPGAGARPATRRAPVAAQAGGRGLSQRGNTQAPVDARTIPGETVIRN